MWYNQRIATGFIAPDADYSHCYKHLYENVMSRMDDQAGNCHAAIDKLNRLLHGSYMI